jgi:aryl-alcohol dehydrogenase-like predicted oxidoreductase
MIAGRSAAAANLSFLVKPNRTMTQASLRFVLAFPEVSVAIPGAKTVAQVVENAGSSDAPPLNAAEIQEARSLYAKDFGL